MFEHDEERRVETLMKTILGFCNESTLRRGEIIGALEGAKAVLLASWLREEGSQ